MRHIPKVIKGGEHILNPLKGAKVPCFLFKLVIKHERLIIMIERSLVMPSVASLGDVPHIEARKPCLWVYVAFVNVIYLKESIHYPCAVALAYHSVVGFSFIVGLPYAQFRHSSVYKAVVYPVSNLFAVVNMNELRRNKPKQK